MKSIYVKCKTCNIIFKKIRHKDSIDHFCTSKCYNNYRNDKQSVVRPCCWCNKEVKRELSEVKKSKSGNIFCGSSCAASFNNTKKRKSKRSKMEIMLFNMLKTEFPKLQILPNDKELLEGYEVDIALPEINLAIEWNGIVHYEPIYGSKKLENIQQRDSEKKIIAQRKKIELIIVPDLVSTEKYVKEAFFNIKKIINMLLVNPKYEN